MDSSAQNPTPAPADSPGVTTGPPQPPVISTIPTASPITIPEPNLTNPPNQNPNITAKPTQTPSPNLPPLPIVEPAQAKTPNLPPLPATNINQPPSAPEKSAKKSINFLNLLLLIGGPLFMIGSALFVFYRLNAKQPKTYFQEKIVSDQMPANQKIGSALTETDITAMKQILLNSPVNPTNVLVTCQSTGETLKPNVPTDCHDPLFEWTGEKPREEGTKIVGYYVYFGPNSNDAPISPESTYGEARNRVRPKRDGQYQQSNKFSPNNLEKGKTYYFAVNSVSDSANPAWKTGNNSANVEELSAVIAKILFVYEYQ